jgi:hypothetical protein
LLIVQILLDFTILNFATCFDVACLYGFVSSYQSQCGVIIVVIVRLLSLFLSAVCKEVLLICVTCCLYISVFYSIFTCTTLVDRMSIPYYCSSAIWSEVRVQFL